MTLVNAAHSHFVYSIFLCVTRDIIFSFKCSLNKLEKIHMYSNIPEFTREGIGPFLFTLHSGKNTGILLAELKCEFKFLDLL